MKTIYHILFSLLFVLAFVGCDDDDDKVIERNQLKLTASAQSVTLTRMRQMTRLFRSLGTKRPV